MNQENAVLRIGLMVSKNPPNFNQAMGVLYEKYKNLTVTVRTGNTQKIENEIADGMIDIGFLVGKTDAKLLHYKKYGTERLVLIGRT